MGKNGFDVAARENMYILYDIHGNRVYDFLDHVRYVRIKSREGFHQLKRDWESQTNQKVRLPIFERAGAEDKIDGFLVRVKHGDGEAYFATEKYLAKMLGIVATLHNEGQ